MRLLEPGRRRRRRWAAVEAKWLWMAAGVLLVLIIVGAILR
jgi:hypothetical protein